MHTNPQAALPAPAKFPGLTKEQAETGVPESTSPKTVARHLGARGQGVARPVTLVLLIAVPVVFLGCGFAGWLRGMALGVDSSVYRAGAVLLLHGRSPYVVNDLGYLHLSFTYPPAAALLFTPLAALPAQLAWAVMASASVLGLALTIRIAIAAVPYWRSPALGSTLLLTAVMLGMAPVWKTIGYGQINIVLMAMVTVDVLSVTVRGSRWGGLLTGVAAAVKLVPLIFIPYLFLTGKRVAAARALAVFAGLQGLTLAIAPQDRAYWTSYVFQTGRIGHVQVPGNQSLDGLMERMTGMSSWSPYAAWVIGAVLAVPALMLVLSYHRCGHDVPTLCVTAFLGLLLAPVSWTPSWVWVAPAGVALLSWLQSIWRDAGQRRAAGWARWAGTGAVAVVIAVFTSAYPGPVTHQRHRALGSLWFFVLNNTYVLTTIAIALVLSAVALCRGATDRTTGHQIRGNRHPEIFTLAENERCHERRSNQTPCPKAECQLTVTHPDGRECLGTKVWQRPRYVRRWRHSWTWVRFCPLLDQLFA